MGGNRVGGPRAASARGARRAGSTHPDTALGFYRDALGFTVATDVTNDDFRWLTVTTPHQPELEITIQRVGSGLYVTEDDTRAMRELMATGLLGALIFDCANIDAVFAQVQASGAEVLPEPADQFYGVRDCAFRDPAGTMVRFKTGLTRTGPAPAHRPGPGRATGPR